MLRRQRLDHQPFHWPGYPCHAVVRDSARLLRRYLVAIFSGMDVVSLGRPIPSQTSCFDSPIATRTHRCMFNPNHLALDCSVSRASRNAFNRFRLSWNAFWARSCSLIALAASTSLKPYGLAFSRCNYLSFKNVALLNPESYSLKLRRLSTFHRARHRALTNPVRGLLSMDGVTGWNKLGYDSMRALRKTLESRHDRTWSH